MQDSTIQPITAGGDSSVEVTDRVFVCCPPGRDTETICSLLRDQGLAFVAAGDPRQLLDENSSDLSAVILSDEFFRDKAAPAILSAVLAGEPEWSDLPVIALLPPDERLNPFRAINGDLASINLTVIERPAQSDTIERAVVSALRARKRQYQVRDFIAALVKAEETLRMQNREKVGISAGGLTHDLNNLLAGILGNASIALDSPRESKRAREFPGHVDGARERAAHLTRQLLAHAGKAIFILEPLELNTLIRDIGDLIRASLGRGVDVRFDLSDNLPSMLADAGQVEQILMNLIVNAVEAVPHGERGTVTVATRLEHLDEAYIRSSLSPNDAVLPGYYVCLEVSDTGTGMTPDILDRIFEPFFTTRASGRGMGLAAVTGIVRGHKGLLRVWSEPGNGSVFRVLFPTASAASCAVKKHGSGQGDLSGLYF